MNRPAGPPWRKKHSLEPTKERLLDASMGCGAAAAYVSDSLDDIRAWTLVAAVSIG